MPIAAHTTGGHATPHLLLGLAVLLLALAGAGTMLTAATRLARHTKRALSARHRRARSRQRDRTHTAAPTAPGTPDPTAAPPAPQPTTHQSPHAASDGGGASALRAPNPDTSAPSNPAVRVARPRRSSRWPTLCAAPSCARSPRRTWPRRSRPSRPTGGMSDGTC